MTLPGWHPDPYGDYQYRYWSGDRWTDDVASFGYQTTDPLTQPVLPDHEVIVWQGNGTNRLSTHRAWIKDGVTRGKTQEVQLWMVADIDVTVNAGQATFGTGRLAFKIEYPGYTGRSHYVMTGVSQPAYVATIARKWINRARRAASNGHVA